MVSDPSGSGDRWARLLAALEDDCAACGGMGRELTAAGRQLAELLARYGFVRDA